MTVPIEVVPVRDVRCYRVSLFLANVLRVFSVAVDLVEAVDVDLYLVLAIIALTVGANMRCNMAMKFVEPRVTAFSWQAN